MTLTDSFLTMLLLIPLRPMFPFYNPWKYKKKFSDIK